MRPKLQAAILALLLYYISSNAFAQETYLQRTSIILNRPLEIAQFYEEDSMLTIWEDLSRVYRPDFTSLTLINDTMWAVTEEHIFRYEPRSQVIEEIHTFDDFYTGKTPEGVLNLINGKIWGTASDGGTKGGGGIIYSIDTDGSNFTIVYEMRGGDYEDQPYGGVILSGGRIWGLTRNGGNTGDFLSHRGIIYSMKPDGTDFQIHHKFTSSEGNHPYGELLDINGTLWGQTKYNSSIFSIKNDGTDYTQHHKVTNSTEQGSDGFSGLSYIDGKIWGTRSTGGQNDFGTIFTIDIDGTNFEVIHHFDSTNGSTPLGQIIEYSGKVWGTTSKGGSEDLGVVYRMDLDGTNFTKIEDMGGLNGALSRSRFLPFDGKLVGLSQGGGIRGAGTMFAVDPKDDSFEVTYDFYQKAIEMGAFLEEDLIQYDNHYYGLTEYGGTNNQGGIFRIAEDGSDYALIYSFDSAYSTTVNFIGQQNGKFYGTFVSYSPNRKSLVSYDPNSGEIDYFLDNVGLIEHTVEVQGETYAVANYASSKGIYRLDFDGETYEKIYAFNSEMSQSVHLTYWKEKFWGYVRGIGSTGGYIYSVNPDGTDFSTTERFDDGVNVDTDFGLTVMGDKLWGVTPRGIYSVTLEGDITYEAVFKYPATGNAPINKLQYFRGKLWGATGNGGDYGEGIVYSFQEGGEITIELSLKEALNDDGGMTVTGPEPVIWKDDAWSNGTGPTATDWVIMASDYYALGKPAFTCSGLEIMPDVTVDIFSYQTIDVQGHLVNYGTLNMMSSASLLTYDRFDYRGNLLSYERYKGEQDTYSMMGTPFQRDTSVVGKDLGTIVYIYDETIPYQAGANDGLDRWINALDEELLPGYGYAAAGIETVGLVGKPSTGEIVVSGLTYTEDETSTEADWGWHLVSNPYMSAINLDTFLDANEDIKGFVALWDDGGSNNGRRTNADYLIANSIGATNGPNGTYFNGYLRSFQGFFVQMDGDDGEVIFTEGMRAKGNNSSGSFFRKRGEIPTIRISMVDEDGLYTETLIGFTDDATKGIDSRYDATKLKASSVHNIYTIVGEKSLAIQGLPNEDFTSILIGVDSEREKVVTLNIELSESIDQGAEVLLHSLLTNSYFNIDEPVKVQIPNGTDQKLFELVMNNKEVLNLPDSELRIGVQNTQIIIQSDQEGISSYSVFNLMGQKLLSEEHLADSNKYVLDPLQNGLYVVNVVLKSGKTFQKKVLLVN